MPKAGAATSQFWVTCLVLICVVVLLVVVLGLPALIGAWLPDLLLNEPICVAKFEAADLGQFFVLQELGDDFYGARLVRVSPSGAIYNYVIDGDASKYWSFSSIFKFNKDTGILAFTSSGNPICEYDTKQNEFYRTWSKRGAPLSPYNEEIDDTRSSFGQWITSHLKNKAR